MNTRLFLEQVESTANKLKMEDHDIEKVISILRDARKTNKTIFIAGNGGSAGTATHFAADLFKMGKVKALSLVDNIPLNSALTNDEGWGEVYIQQLERLFTPGDILITISVHGGKGSDKAGQWSQNLMKAISFVQRHKGKAIGITGFDGGAMVEQCDACIVVPANTTPLVESFHVVLHHLITFSLYEGDRE